MPPALCFLVWTRLARAQEPPGLDRALPLHVDESDRLGDEVGAHELPRRARDLYLVRRAVRLHAARHVQFFAADPRAAVERAAADSSRTTHGAATAVDACRYFAGLILGRSLSAKDELLAPRYSPVPGLWGERPLAPEVDEVAAGSFLRREPPEIEGSGYVVRSLEAALWAFARGGSFREGALLAANLGDDADTTGAVFGQLAGAYYGEAGIPAEWRSKLALLGTIEELADRLHDAARG
jgi:ADP-ribosylglycohydrolase